MEINKYFEEINKRKHHISKHAFCKQNVKLNSEVFKALNNMLNLFMMKQTIKHLKDIY